MEYTLIWVCLQQSDKYSLPHLIADDISRRLRVSAITYFQCLYSDSISLLLCWFSVLNVGIMPGYSTEMFHHTATATLLS